MKDQRDRLKKNFKIINEMITNKPHSVALYDIVLSYVEKNLSEDEAEFFFTSLSKHVEASAIIKAEVNASGVYIPLENQNENIAGDLF